MPRPNRTVEPKDAESRQCNHATHKLQVISEQAAPIRSDRERLIRQVYCIKCHVTKWIIVNKYGQTKRYHP